MNGWILWLAQGAGLGRFPWAPGTVGSLGGLLWFLLLVQSGRFWAFASGMALGAAVSVWACGAAEKILGTTDPGSVVLDEIVAVPVAYTPWVMGLWLRESSWPRVEQFLESNQWVVLAVLFLLFRLFDIVKPWPIRQSQRLPGGWGVTVDDLLAGMYTALVSLVLVF